MSGRSETGQSLTPLPAQDGVCNKACYPPGEKREGGDWDSRDPVCASGLTFMNKAEAMVGAGRVCSIETGSRGRWRLHMTLGRCVQGASCPHLPDLTRALIHSIYSIHSILCLSVRWLSG